MTSQLDWKIDKCSSGKYNNTEGFLKQLQKKIDSSLDHIPKDRAQYWGNEKRITFIMQTCTDLSVQISSDLSMQTCMERKNGTGQITGIWYDKNVYDQLEGWNTVDGDDQHCMGQRSITVLIMLICSILKTEYFYFYFCLDVKDSDNVWWGAESKYS